MSGHSKWSTIKRQKGAADIKRGLTFTKVANAITIAAKSGGGDPESNPRLRVTIESARAVNMPKENIQRAIERGLGKLPGQVLEEVVYEGFGPAKVAFLVEGVTDNRLRTNQEVKNLFERSGGSLSGQGSTAYMFERAGEIKIKSKGQDKEKEMLELIDLGAEDVEDFTDNPPAGSVPDGTGAGGQKYLVYTESSEMNNMSNKIIQLGYDIESRDLVFKPNTSIEINEAETAQKLISLAEKLEGHDDLQKVYANFDIPQEIVEKLTL